MPKCTLSCLLYKGTVCCAAPHKWGISSGGGEGVGGGVGWGGRKEVGGRKMKGKGGQTERKREQVKCGKGSLERETELSSLVVGCWLGAKVPEQWRSST